MDSGNSHQETWQTILNNCSGHQGSITAMRWLGTVNPVDLSPQKSVLEVDSLFTRDLLKRHCEDLLSTVLKDQGLGRLEWQVSDSEQQLSRTGPVVEDRKSAVNRIVSASPDSSITGEASRIRHLDAPRTENLQSRNLPAIGNVSQKASSPGNMRQDLTLDRFVVGKSNQVAYQAVKAVLRDPGSKYNPVFLHGGSGLGKTHLLQAITREFFIQGERSIRYVQCEKFVQMFVRALRNKTINQFRSEFRSLKVLAIDDVQMIAGKKSSQEELIETIDAIQQSGGQVLLACDLPPRQCEFLQQQLKSRFLAGLVARMEPPGMETRLSILEREAIRHGTQVPYEVLHYIADSIRTSVRELLGALTRLFAEVDLRGSTIDIGLARRCLEPLVRQGQRMLTVDQIVEAVARRWSLPPEELYSRSRTRQTALARNVATYLARILTNRSLAEIGAELGSRTHATASNSYRKIRDCIESDANLKMEIEHLEAELRG